MGVGGEFASLSYDESIESRLFCFNELHSGDIDTKELFQLIDHG